MHRFLASDPQSNNHDLKFREKMLDYRKRRVTEVRPICPCGVRRAGTCVVVSDLDRTVGRRRVLAEVGGPWRMKGCCYRAAVVVLNRRKSSTGFTIW